MQPTNNSYLELHARATAISQGSTAPNEHFEGLRAIVKDMDYSQQELKSLKVTL